LIFPSLTIWSFVAIILIDPPYQFGVHNTVANVHQDTPFTKTEWFKIFANCLTSFSDFQLIFVYGNPATLSTAHEAAVKAGYQCLMDMQLYV
jgi:hypothetical protein